MPDADRPLFGELREELSGMADELGQLAKLRLQLVEIELRESAQTTKRFAICGSDRRASPAHVAAGIRRRPVRMAG